MIHQHLDAIEFNKSRIAKHRAVFKAIKLLTQIPPRDRRLWKRPSPKVVVARYHQYLDMLRNLGQQLCSMAHLLCHVHFQQLFVLVWKYTNAVDQVTSNTEELDLLDNLVIRRRRRQPIQESQKLSFHEILTANMQVRD